MQADPLPFHRLATASSSFPLIEVASKPLCALTVSIRLCMNSPRVGLNYSSLASQRPCCMYLFDPPTTFPFSPPLSLSLYSTALPGFLLFPFSFFCAVELHMTAHNPSHTFSAALTPQAVTLKIKTRGSCTALNTGGPLTDGKSAEGKEADLAGGGGRQRKRRTMCNSCQAHFLEQYPHPCTLLTM